MVRKLEQGDLIECSQLYVAAYNDKKWGCHWKMASAQRYLKELMENPRFIGWTAYESGQLRGALLAHERTSWDGNEIYLDELFIGPQYQHMGYGHELLQEMEGYIKNSHLVGVTLLTNKKLPAAHFYEENGYREAPAISLMYKAGQENL